MNRRLYFSFDYGNDLWRANIVRNSWVASNRAADGVWDKSLWDSIKREGEQAIKRVIDKELSKTSVTVVLIGHRTWQRKWVKYEISESYRRGNGLLAVHVNDIRDQRGLRSPRGDNPLNFINLENEGQEIWFSQLYQTYDWIDNHGFQNFGSWIEQAARSAITDSTLKPKIIKKRRSLDPSEFQNTLQSFFGDVEIPSRRTLRVFLCHATNDKPSVRKLYNRLNNDNVDPWLDEEKLLPGQDWQIEIPQAVRNSDIVIVCLSHHSINKIGYVQKEIVVALDVADEQPEGAIYLIPVRLEKCEVPKRLRRWQWVDLFERGGYDRLMSALQVRARTLEVSSPRSDSRSAL